MNAEKRFLCGYLFKQVHPICASHPTDRSPLVYCFDNVDKDRIHLTAILPGVKLLSAGQPIRAWSLVMACLVDTSASDYIAKSSERAFFRAGSILNQRARHAY